MGLFGPWISLTTQAAPSSSSSAAWAFAGVLLVQLIALATFFIRLQHDREKDAQDRRDTLEHFQQAREAETERDANNLRMTMKRDVFLEIAPMFQESMSSLSDYLNLETHVKEIQMGIVARWKVIGQTMGKTVPVASDDTLDAIRALRASLWAARSRLLEARLIFDQSRASEKAPGTIDALHVLFDTWVNETAPFPALMATVAACMRAELEMPFSRTRFEEGIRTTNAKTMEMMRLSLFGPETTKT